MPGRDEEMRSPEFVQATGSVQSVEENGFKGTLEELTDQQDEAREQMRTDAQLDELQAKVQRLYLQAGDIIRQEIHREFEGDIKDLQELNQSLREELATLKSWPINQLGTTTERPALNTVYEHDQRAKEDHEAVGFLFLLINEVCCKAQDAIHDMNKMASLRSYCANTLPLKALGQMPRGFRDNSENICKARISSNSRRAISEEGFGNGSQGRI